MKHTTADHLCFFFCLYVDSWPIMMHGESLQKFMFPCKCAPLFDIQLFTKQTFNHIFRFFFGISISFQSDLVYNL